MADVRNTYRLKRLLKGADCIYHLAAQVAVTTSVTDPQTDYEINLGGTINLLNALREMPSPPPLIFTSTNKVYGGLEDIDFELEGEQYRPQQPQIREFGISEQRNLDFHSPYGCSKGAADQYIIDHCRTLGLKTVVFRMSCIYGPHQYGNEDQGWIAHFAKRAIANEGITLYGDGKQVRDVLFVGDLVKAFELAWQNIDTLQGQAFNIGGGPQQCISLLQLTDMLRATSGAELPINFDGWRPGDQRYYVSDTRKFEQATGWQQSVGVEEGVKKLYKWLLNNYNKKQQHTAEFVVDDVEVVEAAVPISAQ